MNEIAQWEKQSDLESAEATPPGEHLARGIEPIRHLLSDVQFKEDSKTCGLTATIASGKVHLAVLLQEGLLSLDVYVGLIPATPENFATLLAQNQVGHWWYRIDEVGSDGLAIVVRVCKTWWDDVKRLDQLLLEGWREYWSVRAILEVLNGQFDEP